LTEAGFGVWDGFRAIARAIARARPNSRDAEPCWF